MDGYAEKITYLDSGFCEDFCERSGSSALLQSSLPP